MFSNRYIFIYTTVLVAGAAIVLALAATLLQPMQSRNEETATMQEILKAAGKDVEREAAMEAYNEEITAELRVDREGRVVARYVNEDGAWKQVEGDAGVSRAFDCNMKAELDKASKGEADAFFPVFVCRGGDAYIVPLQGKGLWGAIWGYLAIGKDFNTVEGATFGHKGETPGLGAEIAGEDFQKQFEGKKIFDSRKGDFVSVTVQKGGAEKYAGQLENAVDAVSGGTITSNGVTKMLKDCLSCYVPFFERMRGEGRTVDPVAVATDTTAFVPVVGQVAR